MKAIMIDANTDDKQFLLDLNVQLDHLQDKELEVNYSTCYDPNTDEVIYSAVIVVKD